MEKAKGKEKEKEKVGRREKNSCFLFITLVFFLPFPVFLIIARFFTHFL